MAITKTCYSLKKALRQLNVDEYQKARSELMDYFGASNRWAINRRINCMVNVPIQVYNEVEDILVKYGLQKGQIWQIIK